MEEHKLPDDPLAIATSHEMEHKKKIKERHKLQAIHDYDKGYKRRKRTKSNNRH